MTKVDDPMPAADGKPGPCRAGVWAPAALCAGALAFVVPLLFPVATAPWLALHFADAAVLAGLALAAAAACAPRIASDRRTGAVLAAATLGLFGLALGVKWWSGLSSDVLQFGLLPTLDAESYVSQAIQLLHIGRLGDFASRRPLAPSHIAGLLLLDGENLRLTVALLAAACAVATLGLLATLRARFGTAAALAAMAVLVSFIYPAIGTALTESLGYMLGAAAFVLLWHGAGRGKDLMALAGIALFSVGVLARAGALFVLPALAYWAGRRFAANGRFSFRWAAAGLAAGAFGFVLNAALVAWVAAPGQVPFANFASTFYGLVTAGEPWNHVYDLHPELWAMSDADQARTLYRMAVEHMAAHPFDLVRGILYRYNDFLFNVEWHKYVPNGALRMIVLGLALTGLASAWRRRFEPGASLLLAVFAGIFLSVPFLGDGGPRVFAASHAFTAAFVAAGTRALQERIGRGAVAAATMSGSGWAMPPVIAAFAAVPLLALAFAAPSGSLLPPGAAPSCGEGQSIVRGRILADGAVTVCPLGADGCVGIPAERIAATDIWHSPAIARIAGAGRPVSAFAFYIYARDEKSGAQTVRSVLAVADPGAVPQAGAVAACVKPDGVLVRVVP